MPDKMKVCLGVNYIIAINKLPSISHYWDWNNTIEKTGIQNAFSPKHFQNILNNLHFANRITADHANKAYKVRLLTDHFNNEFMEVFSDDVDQSIDEHMPKFKGSSSMRQYL